MKKKKIENPVEALKGIDIKKGVTKPSDNDIASFVNKYLGNKGYDVVTKSGESSVEFRIVKVVQSVELVKFVLYYYFEDLHNERPVYLSSLHVSELYRKKGIGNTVLFMAEYIARSLGFAAVNLQVDSFMSFQYDWYMRKGYVCTTGDLKLSDQRRWLSKPVQPVDKKPEKENPKAKAIKALIGRANTLGLEHHLEETDLETVLSFKNDAIKFTVSWCNGWTIIDGITRVVFLSSVGIAYTDKEKVSREAAQILEYVDFAASVMGAREIRIQVTSITESLEATFSEYALASGYESLGDDVRMYRHLRKYTRKEPVKTDEISSFRQSAFTEKAEATLLNSYLSASAARGIALFMSGRGSTKNQLVTTDKIVRMGVNMVVASLSTKAVQLAYGGDLRASVSFSVIFKLSETPTVKTCVDEALGVFVSLGYVAKLQSVTGGYKITLSY